MYKKENLKKFKIGSVYKLVIKLLDEVTILTAEIISEQPHKATMYGSDKQEKENDLS